VSHFARGRASRLAALLLVIGVAAAGRLPRLDADPPPGFQFHVLSDEGLYAHNARDHALFGRWIVDEYNAPLFTAPLHTLALCGSYAAFGTGLWQTRWPAAVAGILTCFAVFGLLVGPTGLPVAFVAGMLLASSPFLVAQQRTGFTESLQLFGVTVAVLGVWRSRASSAFAILAALGVLIALGAKLASLPVLGVVAAQYACMAWSARADRDALRRVARAAALFAGALTVAGLVALVVLIWPHWGVFRHEIEQMARIAVSADPPVPLLRRLLWFGFREDPGGLRVCSGFLAGSAGLLAAFAWVALDRLTGRSAPANRDLELTCWLWFAVLFAAMATHPSFSPDRRYLLLFPAPAILVALAAFGAPTSPPRSPRGGAWRRWGAWAVLGLGASLALRPLALPALRAATRALPWGAERGVSDATLLALLWTAALGIAGWAVAWRHKSAGFGLTRNRLRIVILAVWAVGTLRISDALIHTTFTMLDTSRAIGRIAAHLPAPRRVAVGTAAETFALDTDLLCLVIRDWKATGVSTNRNALVRYDPPLAIVATWGRRPLFGTEGFDVNSHPLMASFDVRVGSPRRGPPVQVRVLALDRRAAPSGNAP
jgi:4-amino-4-deoxy-L-arabinose transferase-like glycosyltransferase